MTKNDLLTETLRMEKHRFGLFGQIEKCKDTLDLNKYVKLKKEVEQLDIRLEQYRLAHKALNGKKRFLT